MPLRTDRFGLSVALATPFAEDRSIDLPRFMAHGLQSLADGCDSLTLFGTTGEGASLGLNERNRALGAMVGAGIDPARQLVIGIAAASPLAEPDVRAAGSLRSWSLDRELPARS